MAEGSMVEAFRITIIAMQSFQKTSMNVAQNFVAHLHAHLEFKILTKSHLVVLTLHLNFFFYFDLSPPLVAMGKLVFFLHPLRVF